MSGICGVARFDDREVKKDEIQKMLDGMKNRGSDKEGLWVEGNVGLGHKMLWTTPESLYENQPLVSQNNNLVITADARIDNRDELFKKLEINKDNFEVITDIDLILWSYEKWGEKCPHYLLGDFSFALWDNKNKHLFCARDRVGVKPLIYAYSNNEIIFASEISSIFKIDSIEKQFNKDALENFFLMDANHAIDFEHTFFDNIFRLPPASYMIISTNKKKITKYWNAGDFLIPNSFTLEENSKLFLDLLKKSINDRMRSAYPVGSELSGGLDSSTIVALAIQLDKNNPIKTFSHRFGNMDTDESFYIDEVVNHLKCPNFSLRSDTLDYKDKYSLEAYYKHFPDWPTMGFFLPSVPLMELVKEQKVRILLTGRGGDNVTQGNSHFITDWVRKGNILKSIRQALNEENTWSTIRQYMIRPFIPNVLIKIKRRLSTNDNDYTNRVLYSGRRKRNFLDIIDSNDFINDSIKVEAQNILGTTPSLGFDLSPHQFAGKYDIEVRHPFFDSRLIELALSIPKEQKYTSQFKLKQLLREVSKNILPKSIINRYPKVTFSQPIQQHVYANCNADFFKDMKIFSEKILDKNINSDIIHSLNLKEPDCGKLSILWKTCSLEKWFQNNFKGKK